MFRPLTNHDPYFIHCNEHEKNGFAWVANVEKI